jgi:phage repressor protein C with HTH and peptisase S24 domain
VPELLDSAALRPFQWTGVVSDGKKCHTNKVACHTDLEKDFARFLDSADDVLRYFKNERFGFSVTYYEGSRPRQYFPDFIVAVCDASGRETMWLAETKGEIRPNTMLKRQAAVLWCERMSLTSYGSWRHLFLPQHKFEVAVAAGVETFGALVRAMTEKPTGPQLKLLSLDDERVKRDAFKTLLPVYSIKAAAGRRGPAAPVHPEQWIELEDFGKLDDRMFVARTVGRSMEPTINDGDLTVFRWADAVPAQGTVILAEWSGDENVETGGSYAVKRFTYEWVRDKAGKRQRIVVLKSDNPEVALIRVLDSAAANFRVVASLVGVVGK